MAEVQGRVDKRCGRFAVLIRNGAAGPEREVASFADEGQADQVLLLLLLHAFLRSPGGEDASPANLPPAFKAAFEGYIEQFELDDLRQASWEVLISSLQNEAGAEDGCCAARSGGNGGAAGNGAAAPGCSREEARSISSTAQGAKEAAEAAMMATAVKRDTASLEQEGEVKAEPDNVSLKQDASLEEDARVSKSGVKTDTAAAAAAAAEAAAVLGIAGAGAVVTQAAVAGPGRGQQQLSPGQGAVPGQPPLQLANCQPLPHVPPPQLQLYQQHSGVSSALLVEDDSDYLGVRAAPNNGGSGGQSGWVADLSLRLDGMGRPVRGAARQRQALETETELEAALVRDVAVVWQEVWCCAAAPVGASQAGATQLFNFPRTQ